MLFLVGPLFQVARLVSSAIRLRLLITCLVAVGGLRASAADLLISEFMASNKNTLADEDGDFSDWIEIWRMIGSLDSLDIQMDTSPIRIETGGSEGYNFSLSSTVSFPNGDRFSHFLI
jgi:hypothetical protein